ncbi:MAG: hypothetical protein LBO20_09335, partial [Bifidobacteriaceae bacterium]|nr:hypothetical protein [Bifidobacteriaceae bacterium]
MRPDSKPPSREVSAPSRPARLPARAEGRRRDRRGHGPRGPLLPPALPGALTRSARFDEHVRAALSHLEPRWSRRLARLEVAVEDVPPADGVHDGVPLGRSFP